MVDRANSDAAAGRTGPPAQPSKGVPASAPYDADAPASAGTRRSLFPPLWQRFKDQVEDSSALPQPSGAHVTLDDLEKLASLREAADPVYVSRPAGPRQAPGGKISGWVGTPDTSKFARGTNMLTQSEVEEEVSKGTIVMLDDWVQGISELDGWKKKLLFQSMLTDWMQSRFFVRTEAGAKVSFWDLYQHVYHNPELKALARDRHTDVPTLGKEDGGRGGSGEAGAGGSGSSGRVAPGLYGDPGPGMWQSLDLEAARQMQWGLAGTGQLWRRRPTRWLWGADALMDASFAMYVHEDKAHELLGPKYGGKDPRDVIASEQYAADIMRGGPLMGMSFMITAARDIPIADAIDSSVTALARRMERRFVTSAPLPLPRALPPLAGAPEGEGGDAALDPRTARLVGKYDTSLGALFDAFCMLDAGHLAKATKLLSPAGDRLRQGSSLIVTTAPGGKITLQAMTPGLAREREGYVLGAVQDEELCASLIDEFLSREGPADPAFAANVPTGMLMFANGFKTDNTGLSPHMRRAGEGPAYGVELIPARASVFRLPRVGAASDRPGAPPTLVSTVRQRQIIGYISDLYQAAYDAAVAAVPGTASNANNTAVYDAAVAAVPGTASNANTILHH
ncbi:hypothetical protein FOA52_003429 [Chlamydomonas sp. UWO 241]|nr:hypothetical protein FOA52_003429 [Chlamydomonas sp. UWO 241]